MTHGLLLALSANAARNFLEMPSFDPEQEFELCRKMGVSILTLGSAQYPPLLASIKDPPPVLYVMGDPGFAAMPASRPALAVVGSRLPTPYGRRIARNIAAQAARSGAAVVSGLARGIDTEAHRAALDAGGATWAVLGSGFERPYPPENKGLIKAIVDKGGAVLTEVPLAGPPIAANFPKRNRIIAGLSNATVVVEGKKTSGALITAKEALDQGREVFAVPGPVDCAMSEGPIRLIQEGAQPVSGFEDIAQALSVFRLKKTPVQESVGQENLNTTLHEQKILELMGSGPRSLEDLAKSTGWDVELLAGILMEMEVKILIDVYPGQLYAKH